MRHVRRAERRGADHGAWAIASEIEVNSRGAGGVPNRVRRLPAQTLAQPLDLTLECIITTAQLRRALIRAARCRGVARRLIRPRTVRGAVAPVSGRDAALRCEPIRTGGVRIAPEDRLIERESRGRQEQDGSDGAHGSSTVAVPDGCPSHTGIYP